VYYSQWAAVITPNKCASSTVEAHAVRYRIPSWQGIENTINRPQVQVYCTTRNPIDYFVSGYRYLCDSLHWDQQRPAGDFGDHLRHCLHLQQVEAPDWCTPHPDYFSAHAWWGPLRTVTVDYAYTGPVNWIRLEDPNAVWLHLRKLWRLNIPRTDRLNNSSRSVHMRRRITDAEVEMIAQLENWSTVCGYDLYECADNFNRRINTV